MVFLVNRMLLNNLDSFPPLLVRGGGGLAMTCYPDALLRRHTPAPV